jgi:hypothetical protein
MTREAILLLAMAIAPLPVVAIVTQQHPPAIKAGSYINCTLETPIDSSTNQSGDRFTLEIRDPSYPTLHGAKIVGHFTNVQQPRGVNLARMDFLFDTITFVNGTTEPIRAYVVNKPNVVRRDATTPPPAVTAPPAPFAARSSTIVWQLQIGPKNQTSATGGTGYATRPGAQIHVNPGTPVTIELASSLKLP